MTKTGLRKISHSHSYYMLPISKDNDLNWENGQCPIKYERLDFSRMIAHFWKVCRCLMTDHLSSLHKFVKSYRMGWAGNVCGEVPVPYFPQEWEYKTGAIHWFTFPWTLIYNLPSFTCIALHAAHTSRPQQPGNCNQIVMQSMCFYSALCILTRAWSIKISPNIKVYLK